MIYIIVHYIQFTVTIWPVTQTDIKCQCLAQNKNVTKCLWPVLYDVNQIFLQLYPPASISLMPGNRFKEMQS